MNLKDFSSYKKIEILLDKYWEGNTTVAEEKILKNYFSQNEVAAHLKYIQPLFKALKSAESTALPLAFEDKILDKVKATEKEIPIKKENFQWRYLYKFAAAFVLIMVVVYVFQMQLKTSKPDQIEEVKLGTFNDPTEAYDQVKKSLMLISSKMNQGKSYVNDLSKLNAGAKRYNKRRATIKN